MSGFVPNEPSTNKNCCPNNEVLPKFPTITTECCRVRPPNAGTGATNTSHGEYLRDKINNFLCNPDAGGCVATDRAEANAHKGMDASQHIDYVKAISAARGTHTAGTGRKFYATGVFRAAVNKGGAFSATS